MIIYADLILLTNFILDFVMLLAAAKVRGIRANLWRVSASSAIGAFYALFMALPALSFLYSFVIKCLFSVGMIMTAFGYKNLRRFLGVLAAFYAVNAVAAGTVLGFHYMLQSTHEIWEGIVFVRSGGAQHLLGIALWLIVGLAIAGGALFKRVNAGAKRQEAKQAFLAEVEVKIGEERYACTGLIDTGNHLYDPLTRTPVMVMEAAVWKQAIPEPWLEALQSSETDDIVARLSESGGETELWADRIRLVPYRGINGATQLMLAVKPDEVRIRMDGEDRTVEKVLIGLEGGALSSDGAYQAILHPAMVS